MKSSFKVALNYLSANRLYSKADILRLRPELAKAAQKIYDEWDDDKSEELSGGGICHEIADEIAITLNQHGIESGTVSASVGDQHVYAIAKVKEGVFEVDISPNVYERGSGYSWKKVPDVTFDANDISVSMIHNDPNKFEECINEY
jgi:hypothetical protein